MTRRSSLDADPVLGRKRTADLLRKLRDITKQLRMVNARVDEIEREEAAAKARPLLQRRRQRSN